MDTDRPLLDLLTTGPTARNWNKFYRSQGAVILPDKFSAVYLRRFEFVSSTLIDIGVADGTPELYDAFPDAEIVLIDPLAEAAQLVERKYDFGDRPVRNVTCAVGREPGEATLRIATNAFSKSTLHEPTAVYGRDEFVERVVEIRPLDDIVAEIGLKGPFGIKIDTEGHEIDVLLGAATTLADTEFVIVEASVKQRFAEGYRFSELVAALAQHDFELLDVLGLTPGAALFLDCLFVKRDSRLFSSRST